MGGVKKERECRLLLQGTCQGRRQSSEERDGRNTVTVGFVWFCIYGWERLEHIRRLSEKRRGDQII